LGRSAGLANKLTHLGYKVLEVPCIGIENCQTITHPDIRLATDFSKYSIIIFVSVNAVVSFFNLFGENTLQNAKSTKIFAIGQSTASSLSSYGVQDVIYPLSEYDQNSEGFLSLPELADTGKDNILLIRGDTGRDFITNYLRIRATSFTELITYKTVLVDFDLSWAGGLKNKLIIVITSVKILENFYDKIHSMLSKNIINTILDSHLLVISKRIYDQAKILGFKNITVSNSMSDDAIIRALV